MAEQSSGERLTIRGGRIVDVRAGRSGEPVDVLIEGDRIKTIGAVDPMVTGSELDARGTYLAPGLIDVHVHLSWDGGADPVATYLGASREARAATALASAREAVTAGITTVRDLGGPIELIASSRSWNETPDVVAAGPPVTRPGGHLGLFGGSVADGEAARSVVAAIVAAGARAIKVVLSGGGLTPGTDPSATELPAETVRATIDAAHDAGLRVAAHCHAVSSIRLALEAGVDTIEHASMVRADGQPRFDQDLADALAAAGVAVSPTAAGAVRTAARYRSAGDERSTAAIARLEARAAFVRRWTDHGVLIVAGSDAGVTDTPFDSLHEELRIYAEAGLGADGALRAATVDAAAALGFDDRGEIAEGMRADLLVVRDDPFESVETLREPIDVVAAGKLTGRDARSGHGR